MAGSSYAVDISKISNGRQASLQDSVAVEEPLEIRIGYSTPDGRATRSVSITMRTPGNDKELAAGFLYGESIINDASDIASIEVCGPPAPDSGNHNVIRIDLGAGVEFDLGRLQRHFYTTSSCGVCGKTSLDALRAIGAQQQTDNATSFSKEVLVTIRDLAEEGMTCLLVTHEMGFARELADHMYFTDNGVIVEHGPPRVFFEAPEDPRTQEFLSQIL